MNPHYYLDSRGRAKDARRHTTLARGADRGPRVLHPRDARALGLDRLTPWTADFEADAASVRAGIIEPPSAERVPEHVRDPLVAADPVPDWTAPRAAPEVPEPAPAPTTTDDEPPTSDLPATDDEPPTSDLPATDDEPPASDLRATYEPPTSDRAATDHAGPTAPHDFSPPSYADPDREPVDEAQARAEHDPDCPHCASESRTCARGHTYMATTEEEARATLYLVDGLYCAARHKKTGLPQIPLLAMSSADACAAMGMPEGSYGSAEAMVEATRRVISKHGAFMARYSDEMTMLGAVFMLERSRAAAQATPDAAPAPTEAS